MPANTILNVHLTDITEYHFRGRIRMPFVRFIVREMVSVRNEAAKESDLNELRLDYYLTGRKPARMGDSRALS